MASSGIAALHLTVSSLTPADAHASPNFFPLLYVVNTLLYLAMISVGRQATKVREELVNKDEPVN